MKKQPQSFIDMAAAVTDQKSKKRGFKNSDEVGTVPNAIKEDASNLVAMLLEMDDLEPDFKEVSHGPEFEVWPVHIDLFRTQYSIQVPDERGFSSGYVNYVFVDRFADQEDIKDTVMNRMRLLAATRHYPELSVFNTPWGQYLIQNGEVSET